MGAGEAASAAHAAGRWRRRPGLQSRCRGITRPKDTASDKTSNKYRKDTDIELLKQTHTKKHPQIS